MRNLDGNRRQLPALHLHSALPLSQQSVDPDMLTPYSLHGLLTRHRRTATRNNASMHSYAHIQPGMHPCLSACSHACMHPCLSACTHASMHASLPACLPVPACMHAHAS
eukprot:365541-Chlamydomonas_euryale.AAC.2